MATLTLEKLREAVRSAAALKQKNELQPAGGEGDKVFPPTYEGGRYAEEERNLPGRDSLTKCVLLDSVASQANRFELALLEAHEEGRAPIPVLTVDFEKAGLTKSLRVTSLEAPHRIADALLRDSIYEGVPFRKSSIGKQLDSLDAKNATALLEFCPTALTYGMWDSTGPKGGLGAKFPRVVVSEIVGIGAVQGKKTSSRIDPAQILKNAGDIYLTTDGGWTYGKGKGKKLKPSEINHGNIVPTIVDGGYTIESAVQISVISLAGLRKLRFPVKGKQNAESDLAARTALAALALYASALATERGYDLRSRCLLVPTHSLSWEILTGPEEDNERLQVTAVQALAVLKEAIAAVKAAGLPWREEEIILEASPELGQLVKRSQELQVTTVEGDE